jgi:hypothetical protein
VAVIPTPRSGRVSTLADLIEVAAGEHLINESVGRMAGSVTEHRDLIHPAAELRGDIRVDAARAAAMVAFLVVLLGELISAEQSGALASYAQK